MQKSKAGPLKNGTGEYFIYIAATARCKEE